MTGQIRHIGQHCPTSQEPTNVGNSGNTGNGLLNRAFQPLPLYKKSGNNWQHTPQFQYRGLPDSAIPVITVASTFASGNGCQSWKPRNPGALPVLPLLPVFLKSQKHWIRGNAGQVMP